ncbi:MAG TPA: helix-turn-helix transcriptional regulator [Chloroflexota bacterium]|nr:helix-turn-helix transcriptional regulator [Chloroflexota bacterium]
MLSTPQRPIGEQLRQWREHRRLSQLDLALLAEVSTRHVSFVETGRAAPSRDMVLRLAEQLEVPLRERNALLLSAGFAPAYGESNLDAPHMSAVRDATRQVLSGHEPYPAVVVDRHWNLVDANRSVGVFVQDIPPDLLEPPINVMRVSLHPRGMAPRIVNLAEWRGHLLHRLRRQVELTADAALEQLYAELRSYLGGEASFTTQPGRGVVVAPLRLRHQDAELAFFSIVASFGTPIDITVDELAIEAFYPADARTAEVLRAAAAAT